MCIRDRGEPCEGVLLHVSDAHAFRPVRTGVTLLYRCLLYTSSQKKDYRFKIGTIGEKKPEDWIVVEGQHEPLIDLSLIHI